MASVPSLCDILIPLEKNSRSDGDAESSNTVLIQLRKGHHKRMRSPYTIQKFYKFLKRAHCEENLEFSKKLISSSSLSKTGVLARRSSWKFGTSRCS